MVKEGLVRAFMPGLIVRVLKGVGEPVNEGDTVLFMEAMKMENAIVAPRAGKISRLGPKEGETVLTGDVLFVVD
jgi:biotin carboxyl carrier protein